MQQCVKVTARPAGSNVRYYASIDGEEVLIRTSNRIYQQAFLYSRNVAGGNKTGLSWRFSFGKAPISRAKDAVVARFDIIF